MPKNYFIQIDNKQTGPFSAKQILNQSIRGEFKLWCQGMSDWKTYSNLAVFREEIKQKTPHQNILDNSKRTKSSQENELYQEDNVAIELASHGRRLVAALIHGAIFWTILLVFFSTDMTENMTVILSIATLGLNLISYHFKSGNIGHGIMGLKVVHADSKANFNNPLLGYLRELVKGFLSFFIIPLAILFFNANRQNLYDLFFNTLVVKVDPVSNNSVKKNIEIVKDSSKDNKHGENREYRR